MESVEGRTMKLSSLPLFPQPLEIASAAIPTLHTARLLPAIY